MAKQTLSRRSNRARRRAPAVTPPPGPPPARPGRTTTLITTTANASNHGTKVDLQASIIEAVIFGLLTYYAPTDDVPDERHDVHPRRAHRGVPVLRHGRAGYQDEQPQRGAPTSRASAQF